jgi:hypothetical protein
MSKERPDQAAFEIFAQLHPNEAHKGNIMSTERERKILETAAGACRILIECRTCGKLRTHGMMPCDCDPTRERCVDCLKVCRKILKELKPNNGGQSRREAAYSAPLGSPLDSKRQA